MEVGVGVGERAAGDSRTHPRTTARVTHCILLPLSSTAWGYGPASARQRTAKARHGRVHVNERTHGRGHSATEEAAEVNPG